MRLAILALTSALVGPQAIAGQNTALPPNPGSACFEVVLRSAASEEFRGEVEFILAPSVSPDQSPNQVWDLHGPIRSDGAALWWPEGGDSVAAVWLREQGVLWELHLDAVPEVMRGTAVQVLPKPEVSELFQVEAIQLRCRGSSR